MVSKAYETVVTEHFDILDDRTRFTLLNINESDQNKVLESLTSRLYKSIMDKVDDIDFGSIPETKGDMTQLENYDNLIECIDVIKGILVQYRQSIEPVEVILVAIENIQNRIDMWRKAFTMKMDLPVLMYNTVVLSIVSSVSLIIATSIEFIKDPSDNSYGIKFDKVSYVRNKDGLLFDNLKKFNNACSSGELDRSLDHIFKSTSRQLTGMSVLSLVSAAAVIGIVVNIIPILRELVFFFFNTKQNISDYFTIQADLVQVNAEYVKANPNLGLTSSEREDIVNKQNKVAQVFRKISNSIAIDNKTSEAKAKRDINNNKKKYNIDDVVDSKLDSLDTSKSSIF